MAKKKEYIKAPARCDKPEELPMTLDEIGDVMNVTRERVRQIAANAMRKMRERLAERGIEKEDLL